MLRGINVSGRNKLAMADLRALVAAAGGGDVQTYIQSGNAVFTSRRSASAVARALEAGIEEALGNRVPVVMRSREELEAVLGANPFLSPGQDIASLHVTFLNEAPNPAAVVAAISARSKATDPDAFEVVGREVFLRCPHGYGNTKLTNAFFEKKLGSEATTRNWKTVTTLVEMARG
jgi:uncharacterized protein (DUF1697 family)